jgi:hypothetical protein
MKIEGKHLRGRHAERRAWQETEKVKLWKTEMDRLGWSLDDTHINIEKTKKENGEAHMKPRTFHEHSGSVKRIVFWDMTPCSLLICTRRFGGKYRLHLQGRRNSPANQQASRILSKDEPIGTEFYPLFPIYTGLPTGEHSACHLVAHWFAELFLWPWRGRQYVPPKHRVQLNRLHGVISQKTILFITPAVNTSNPTFRQCDPGRNILYYCLTEETGLRMLPEGVHFRQLNCGRYKQRVATFPPALIMVPVPRTYISNLHRDTTFRSAKPNTKGKWNTYTTNCLKHLRKHNTKYLPQNLGLTIREHGTERRRHYFVAALVLSCTRC